MQRDPLQSEAQLWNWHTAVNNGVTYLNTMHNNAQVYLTHWYNILENDDDLDNDWLWDPSSEFPERVWDEAFSRYNTGKPIHSPNGNRGERNCSSGDHDNGNQTGCNYADSVRGHINNLPWQTQGISKQVAEQ